MAESRERGANFPRRELIGGEKGKKKKDNDKQKETRRTVIAKTIANSAGIGKLKCSSRIQTDSSGMSNRFRERRFKRAN
jgi:hypothetical protein